MCHKAGQNKMLGLSQKVSNYDAVTKQYAYMPSNTYNSMILNKSATRI